MWKRQIGKAKILFPSQFYHQYFKIVSIRIEHYTSTIEILNSQFAHSLFFNLREQPMFIQALKNRFLHTYFVHTIFFTHLFANYFITDSYALCQHI